MCIKAGQLGMGQVATVLALQLPEFCNSAFMRPYRLDGVQWAVFIVDCFARLHSQKLLQAGFIFLLIASSLQSQSLKYESTLQFLKCSF
jgi:hypothetical protein